jgi:hypothetical protein
MTKKLRKKFPAPPCLGEALRRGTLLTMNKCTPFRDFFSDNYDLRSFAAG